ncbi:prepilin-type N-terminal cleavage/methylation domain-containing protein [Candidatus Dependentiae bacterium]|nr:prepilin-type N-terminal cleavage/methylation domain-containing protein [Candidatus Dependentiae bacterium]
MKKKGITIIELVIAIIIIGIIAGIFTDILRNTFDMYENVLNDNKRNASAQLIIAQLKDEINHSAEIFSVSPTNLILLTYDNGDTAMSFPKKIIYNHIGNKLYKYYEPLNDTSSFNYNFYYVNFKLENYTDSIVEISLNDFIDTFKFQCSNRN